MSTVAPPRPAASAPAPPPTASAPWAGPRPVLRGDPFASREPILVAAVLALLISGVLAQTRVFIGLDFLRPLLAAVLLPVGLSIGVRRLGGGPVTSLLAGIVGWAAFVGVAFLPETLAFGVLPTRATASALTELWTRGLELVRLRPSPTFAETGLLLLSVTGVWAIAHGVEGLVFRHRRPFQAIAMTLMLWTVPLAVAPPAGAAWLLAAPLLASAAALILTLSGAELGRWGTWVAPRVPKGARGVRRSADAGAPLGALLAAAAILIGALGAGLLPGYGDPPWYELRGLGGTTLTTNPIVDIKSRLVARDGGPVMRVKSTRPVYLRTTALDTYGDNEEWTSTGIRGTPVDRGRVPITQPVPAGEAVTVEITVEGLDPRTVLVPAPYQAVRVDGEPADAFQYDDSNATFTLDRGTTIAAGDVYIVEAEVPAPSPAALDAARGFADPRYTALPDNVPPEVGALARQIVADAGARTPFQQALAIQEELRTWAYSLDPPAGHGSTAMLSFLETRTGYCEQFAGTMAVMLRTLGLPTRVAVGYTPGTPIGETPGAAGAAGVPPASAGGLMEFSVSDANAHAWVEVLFGGYGWISFEPTPRSDGDVLVPSTATLAPTTTLRPQITPTEIPELTDAEEARLLGEERAAFEDALPLETVPREVARSSTAARVLRRSAPVAGLAAVLTGLGFGLRLAGRPRARPGLAPRERVLAASAALGRVARGAGVGRRSSETDREHLDRVVARARTGSDATKGVEFAADALAGAAARARWAPTLPDEAGPQAESAAAFLAQAVVADLPRPRRALVAVRAGAAAVTDTVTGAMGRDRP